MVTSAFSQLWKTTQGRRTIAFLVVLCLLLVAADRGAPTSIRLLLFCLYIVTSTIWIRGQYQDFLDGTPWLWNWIASIVICLIGVALIGVSGIGHVDGAGLYGAVALYFGMGAIVARWRAVARNRARNGGWLAGLGAVLGLIGGGLLGRAPDLVSLFLLAASMLALLPIAIGLLSEAAIQRFGRPSAPGEDPHALPRVVGMLGGTVIFLALAVVGGYLAHSPWVFGALVAFGLLIVTITSSTQADIAVLIAVIALLGATPRQASMPGALTPAGKARVLVALGDSYMSGEGAAIYYAGTDEGGVNGCRRSPTSWAAAAGQQAPFDGLVFLACSGARTRNVRDDPSSSPTPQSQYNEPGTQLAQYKARQESEKFTPSLVVLSIGGNDAGFSTIGLMCIAPGNCNKKSTLWTDGLDQVQRLLEGTYDDVRATFPDTPVVVVPYPDPIDNTSNPKHCGQAALSAGEREFIASFLTGKDSLNARVRQAAADHRFYYLDKMQTALADAHLQLCDPLNDGRPGLNFVALRSVNGIAEQRFSPANWSHGSLHPNERGHAAMLRVFQNWLAANPNPSAEAPPDPDTPASANPVKETGTLDPIPCDLLDTTPSGCRREGEKWAKQQVGELLLYKGWLALLVVGAAWIASVSFFAWRKRTVTPIAVPTATSPARSAPHQDPSG